MKKIVWFLLSCLILTVFLVHSLSLQKTNLSASLQAFYHRLSEVIAQHQAILLLTPAPNSLPVLQKQFPHIVGIEHITTQSPIQADADHHHYRIINLENGGGLYVNLATLLENIPYPQGFDTIEITWNNVHMNIMGNAYHQTYWTWHKTLHSSLESFTITAKASPKWFNFPWLLPIIASSVLALMFFFIDILQQQNYKQKQAKLKNQLSSLTKLNTMGEMTTNVTHELNQPLTAILSYTQAAIRLIEHTPPEKVKSLLESSVVQIRRISDLLSKLRNNLQTHQIKLQPVDLKRVILNVCCLLENEIKRNDIKIINQLANDFPLALGNILSLEQVIHNIFSNAIHVQADHKELKYILIKGKEEYGNIRIVIVDNGPGLDAETIPFIFSPFFTTRKEGIGLGLTICETLMHQMKGEINATNSPTGGAKFILQLKSYIE